MKDENHPTPMLLKVTTLQRLRLIGFVLFFPSLVTEYSILLHLFLNFIFCNNSNKFSFHFLWMKICLESYWHLAASVRLVGKSDTYSFHTAKCQHHSTGNGINGIIWPISCRLYKNYWLLHGTHSVWFLNLIN